MNHVHNGTPVHNGPSLCRSCRFATVVSGTRLDEEMVVCSNLSRPNDLIRFKVVQCSAYNDKSKPSLDAMQTIAWALCTDKSGRKIGFLSPHEAKQREDIVKPKWLDESELVR